MNLKNRLDKLERGYRKRWTVKNMTDDGLAELVTGIPGTKSDNLTDEYLQAAAGDEKPSLP